MQLKYLKNVVTLQFHEEKCTGCGMCVAVCPHHVFELHGGRARITDRDLCMECGACQKNCAFSAIEVDEGVGCAAAIIYGILHGTEPTCDCSED